MFSPQGGNLQERIYDIIVAALGDQSKPTILDIGTGVLAVKLALHNPESQVTGVDYWGKDWEYAKEECEANAKLADVARAVRFVKGDAASLNFPDASFSAVVSNLTFHEVRSVQNKRAVLQEALRVLKAGGQFAFVDYFYEPRYYGSVAEFEAFLQGLGLQEVTLQPLRSLITIPRVLRLARALGGVGAISGRK